MLSCTNLCLEYPDGERTKTIFENVSLTAEKGEILVLLGPSGSGKSSLIYLLSSLRPPTAGQVLFNGTELSSLTAKSAADIRKNHFGFIFQMHFLLPYLTVLENVMTGHSSLGKQVENKALEVLQRLGLKDHVHKKNHQLSGGERQRVAIARALVNEPDIIFADEPTASLDHSTACEVVSMLKTQKKGSIVVMATHDTSILSGDERIIELANGGIRAAI